MIVGANGYISQDYVRKGLAAILADTGETLYTSGLVEPGMCIESITLSKGLARGEYKTLLKIHYYTPEGFAAAGGVITGMDLTADRGGVRDESDNRRPGMAAREGRLGADLYGLTSGQNVPKSHPNKPGGGKP